MEMLSIHNFSIRIVREVDRTKQLWIYCVIRVGDNVYCSRSVEINGKEWVELISKKDLYQIQFPNIYTIVKLEIWNYDAQIKLAQTNINRNQLPIQCRQKQLSLNNKQIHIKLSYERRQNMEEMKDNDKNIQKINYNKSDPNLKIPIKCGSINNIKKYPNIIQDIQASNNKYQPHTFQKWRFIPVRNQTNPHKLKL